MSANRDVPIRQKHFNKVKLRNGIAKLKKISVDEMKRFQISLTLGEDQEVVVNWRLKKLQNKVIVAKSTQFSILWSLSLFISYKKIEIVDFISRNLTGFEIFLN